MADSDVIYGKTAILVYDKEWEYLFKFHKDQNSWTVKVTSIMIDCTEGFWFSNPNFQSRVF